MPEASGVKIVSARISCFALIHSPSTRGVLCGSPNWTSPMYLVPSKTGRRRRGMQAF
ncbi:uncharacterized protein TrAFT101_005632 [Trichoderma asperellum]|uniref:uncharacterized protein n=1 Tax=Trichoderma asperellum TaxID=101201 RepID=UPI00332F22C1|nr:hypothetical protein TrAFT101_005632 [Trichoderma asperellum]